MDIELIRKLYNFHINANRGLAFDEIDNYKNYSIAYHNKIKEGKS